MFKRRAPRRTPIHTRKLGANTNFAEVRKAGEARYAADRKVPSKRVGRAVKPHAAKSTR
jgi:hypothetical protein